MSDRTILLLSGPNLNLLGEREPEVYGTETLDDHVNTARTTAAGHGLDLEHVQSNHEGELVEAVQRARGRCAAIIVNAAALTHYGWSLHDALAAFDGVVVELHLSNPNARAVAAHLGGRPRGHRLHRGLPGPRLRAGGRRGGKVAEMTSLLTPLPPMETALRADRLRARLAAAGCDALLVTRLVNIRYLTGFTGSAALLLVRADDLVFVTDGRYGEQSAEQLGAAGVAATIEVSTTMTGQQAALQAAARGVTRLGLEAESVTWAQQRRFASDWFPEAELVPTAGLVEDLRRLKDAGEVARMQAAAAAADGALAAVRPMLAERPEEREVALALEVEMRRAGASGPSFETIVAAGPNGAKPHARPSTAAHRAGGAGGDRLRRGDRRLLLRHDPHRVRRRAHLGHRPAHGRGRGSASQRAGVAAVAAGVTGKAVDEACRAVISDAGWGDAFVHGTGHGVGLEIHEAPGSRRPRPTRWRPVTW